MLVWTHSTPSPPESTRALELSKCSDKKAVQPYLRYMWLTTVLISFAWAEMRMVAANIFSRFDVIEVPGQVVDFRQYITMQFADGHWNVRLKPRVMKDC